MLKGSTITALLGPTNTGKTHRAVERMLTYRSGMIGLPLRLLAREVYDRLTVRLGEARIALVTGEEKRVPSRPDYWICTVEAMPMDRDVEFLAVDEVQLAAHDQRGHVFTNRLLTARGECETWFMGAATMQPIVRHLVPTAAIAEHPRLSRLSFTGAAKLSRLPPRTAVVGFSAAQVYEAAERLRALRGGAAVVLGALSPRTRNAQVAMYQAGEVDYIVATDAIGMGLNLDVAHVAFTALRKFDGRESRDLDAAEIAQIAGRAGRYLNDGTFGTVAPVSLPRGAALSVETHRFPAVRQLLWRNADLDLTSVDALLQSLDARPRSRSLRFAKGAEDAAALARLAADPAIRARARGEEAVGLLWDVCRIPDYRKLLFESHVALLRDIFDQLSGPRGRIDRGFIAQRVREIDDTKGDVDALLARIAAIRTWTYVANQGRWVDDAAEWQASTRAVEDRLSDSLHDRLVQRFVERLGAKRARTRAASTNAAPRSNGIVKEHPFAKLEALRATLAGAALAPASRDTDGWVERVVTAKHDAFACDASGRIALDERVIGQLTRGTGLLLPDVRVLDDGALGAGARTRIGRRLIAYARDLVDELLGAIRRPPDEMSPAARGLLYQLEQGLGTALASSAAEQLAELDERDGAALAKLGVAVGAHVIYVPHLLKPAALRIRVALWAAHLAGRAHPPLPPPGASSVRVAREVDARAYAAIGYPVIGGRAIRADVVERVVRALSDGEPDEPVDGATLARWIGCNRSDAERIASELADRTAHQP